MDAQYPPALHSSATRTEAKLCSVMAANSERDWDPLCWTRWEAAAFRGRTGGLLGKQSYLPLLRAAQATTCACCSQRLLQGHGQPAEKLTSA